MLLTAETIAQEKSFVMNAKKMCSTVNVKIDFKESERAQNAFVEVFTFSRERQKECVVDDFGRKNFASRYAP